MENLKELVVLGARTSFDPTSVTYLEADINYTVIHNVDGKSRVISNTLKSVHAHLTGQGEFVRISRKFVVNMQYVKRFKNNQFVLSTGKKLMPSRRRLKGLTDIGH
ncbi:LytTr DNA-binding domain-containing protein [Spirosomataceae bacterium TFI 002]|nr:LytTr DNA-binding domain-containing protein [Spirosomataceae bacterium TFI 002]